MKEKRILNILGKVDEKYIEEAAPSKRTRKSRSWVKWGALAACLCLVAITFIIGITACKKIIFLRKKLLIILYTCIKAI